jgi:hypothetical protein
MTADAVADSAEWDPWMTGIDVEDPAAQKAEAEGHDAREDREAEWWQARSRHRSG